MQQEHSESIIASAEIESVMYGMIAWMAFGTLFAEWGPRAWQKLGVLPATL